MIADRGHMAAERHELIVNGERHVVSADTVARALDELGFGAGKVATALNGDFVPAASRATTLIKDGDKLEIVSPRQGG
jgi:sulfur carrier protein